MTESRAHYMTDSYHPSLIGGSPILWCRACGAVVLDLALAVEAHDAWHAGMTAISKRGNDG